MCLGGLLPSEPSLATTHPGQEHPGRLAKVSQDRAAAERAWHASAQAAARAGSVFCKRPTCWNLTMVSKPGPICPAPQEGSTISGFCLEPSVIPPLPS